MKQRAKHKAVLMSAAFMPLVFLFSCEESAVDATLPSAIDLHAPLPEDPEEEEYEKWPQETPFAWALFDPKGTANVTGSVYFETNPSGLLNVTIGLTEMNPNQEYTIVISKEPECRPEKSFVGIPLKPEEGLLKLGDFLADDEGAIKAHVSVTVPNVKNFIGWASIVERTLYLKYRAGEHGVACTEVEATPDH